jgi:hypothetical protein
MTMRRHLLSASALALLLALSLPVAAKDAPFSGGDAKGGIDRSFDKADRSTDKADKADRSSGDRDKSRDVSRDNSRDRGSSGFDRDKDRSRDRADRDRSHDRSSDKADKGDRSRDRRDVADRSRDRGSGFDRSKDRDVTGSIDRTDRDRRNDRFDRDRSRNRDNARNRDRHHDRRIGDIRGPRGPFGDRWDRHHGSKGWGWGWGHRNRSGRLDHTDAYDREVVAGIEGAGSSEIAVLRGLIDDNEADIARTYRQLASTRNKQMRTYLMQMIAYREAQIERLQARIDYLS